MLSYAIRVYKRYVKLPIILGYFWGPVIAGFIVGLMVARGIRSGVILGYLCMLIAEFTMIFLSPFSILPLTIMIAPVYIDSPVSSVFLNNPLVFSMLGALGGFLGSLFRRYKIDPIKISEK